MARTQYKCKDIVTNSKLLFAPMQSGFRKNQGWWLLLADVIRN